MTKLLPYSIFISTFYYLLSATSILAHGGEVPEETEAVAMTTLEDSIRSTSIKVVIIASIIILAFIVLTVLLKHFGEGLKKFLFAGVVIPTIAATLYMVGSTLYLNFTSSSGGPVHWHADLEIWDCGNKLDFVDPQGISNKVGTSTFHEHNDGRIHIEGVVKEKDEASLGKFFKFVGGSLSTDGFEVPTNNGQITRHNNDTCQNGDMGTLQVFVYQTRNDVFNQQKLNDPASYVLTPEGNVPPGDCIIVEFGKEREKTDKLCNFYKLKVKTGEIKPASEFEQPTDLNLNESGTQEENLNHGN